MSYVQEEHPLVSIIIPLYNEELFLEETLQGVLAQQYPNIEILIADNNSKDNSAAICRKLTQNDPRVSFFQHDKNIGAHGNHLFLFEQSKGKYIIFTSGHDKWSGNYIEENMRSLAENPHAVIAYGTPQWIDHNGKCFDKFAGWYDTRGLTPIARYFTVFWGKPNPILGLIKRQYLPKLEGYGFAGADMVLLCDLALQGEFIHTDNTVFYRRQNRTPESHEQRLERYKSADMQISTSSFERLFPLIWLPIELFKTVLFSSLPIPQKITLFLLLITAIPAKYFSEKNK